MTAPNNFVEPQDSLRDFVQIQSWETPPQHNLSSADKFDLFWECHAPELSRIFEQERELFAQEEMTFGEFVKECWCELAENI